MATVRVTNLTAITRSTSTAILGAVRAGWSVSSNVVFSKSAGDWGPSTADISAWNVTGFIELEDLVETTALQALALAALKFGYKTGGGTAKVRTIDKVRFGSISNITLKSATSGETVTRYRVAWQGVFEAADTTIANLMAVA